MEDIRRRDREIFLKHLTQPRRVSLAVFLGLFALFLTAASQHHFLGLFAGLFVWAVSMALVARQAFLESIGKRFMNRKFADEWAMCEERQKRFHKAHADLKKRDIVQLSELPATVDKLSADIYAALRRADILFAEVLASEGSLPRSHAPQHVVPDRQAQELYRLADKNIAEYQAQYRNVMGSIQRTEAQAAVFSTTLDTLRIRMLNYRLVGKEVEIQSQEFLSVVAEAKMQFAAIDQALDEIELSPFPKSVAIIPPSVAVEPPAVQEPSALNIDNLQSTPPPAPKAPLADSTEESRN